MSNKAVLPHRAYDRFPLVYAAPPVAEVLQPVEPMEGYIGISTVSFGFNYNDGSINTAFPSAVRVATQSFGNVVGISSVTLSTSIVNATTDGVVGVFVMRDNTPIANVLSSTDIYVEHFVNAGLGHSMRSGTAYADDTAPKFNTGEKLALYISSAGTGFAGNLIVAMVTIRYFSLS